MRLDNPRKKKEKYSQTSICTSMGINLSEKLSRGAGSKLFLELKG